MCRFAGIIIGLQNVVRKGRHTEILPITLVWFDMFLRYLPSRQSFIQFAFHWPVLICDQLLREIPPDGDKFATMVEVSHALGILILNLSVGLFSSTNVSYLQETRVPHCRFKYLMMLVCTLIFCQVCWYRVPPHTSDMRNISSLDSISSTQRRTGMAGKMRDAQALWKKGTAIISFDWYIHWSVCFYNKRMCCLSLAWHDKNDSLSHLFPLY